MSFWNNDKYLRGLLTDDDLEPTEPPKPTVKVETNGLYSTSGIGAFDIDVPQGTVPSGTLPITENGTYDVTRYASADVDVPQGTTPSGTIPITENGAYDVTEYASAEVDVPQGITPSGSITLTSENTYDVTDKATAVVDMSATRANLAEAVTAKGVDTLPTSSFDTIATNIGLISGGGSLPSVISKIDGGSFTLASDTVGDVYNIAHNLGVTPKGFVIWADELNAFQVVSRKALVRAWVSTDDYYASESSIRYIFALCLQRNTNGTTYNQADSITYANQDTLWANANTINYRKSDTYYIADVPYKWIAWA